MNVNPQRGEVWYAQFDPTRGHEQAKKRPCIILSIDRFNRSASNLVIAVPLTSKLKPYAPHLSLDPPEGGLAQRSYILCEQIRVLSLCRFSNKPLGRVSDKTLYAIEDILTTLLGFRIPV